MQDLILALQGTPLPTILVVAGILFLLLSLSGGFVGKIDIPKTRQTQAAIIGTIMLLLGITVHVMPVSQVGLQEAPENNEVHPYSVYKTWPLVLSETFTHSQAGWYIGENSNENRDVKCSIAFGRYNCDVNSKRDNYTYFDVPAESVLDFYFAADVKLEIDSMEKRAAVGLMFRKTYNNHYRLLLHSWGLLLLEFYDKNESKVLIDWLDIKPIKANDFNRLAVSAHDDQILIFLNDKLVAKTRDKSQLQGTVGIYAAGFEEEGIFGHFEFDNIELRAP
jgi:hypothetical protein